MTRKIEIARFWDECVSAGMEPTVEKDYERLYLSKGKFQTRVFGDRFADVVALSRHKTEKNCVRITAEDADYGIYEAVVTVDHVCMILNRDRFFENTQAKNIRRGDCVALFDEKAGKERRGVVQNIEDVGGTDEYVYDLEVDDGLHSFYADDVLVHNSQFCNIACITDDFKKNNPKLPDELIEWSDDDKLALWKFVEDFVENEVNGFVQDLVKTKTGSEHPEVLRYSLEYIADKGIYEAKKHYAVRKILAEGPEIVNKIKYSGIELKKGSIPVQVKKLLGEIYENTLCHGWHEKDYREYMNSAYNAFKKMTIDEISIWKGYKAERQSTGFLQMQKGSTAIASAAQFHNQLLDQLGIGKKYETIRPGSKVRFCYINDSNKYGIKYIAYNDGQWPKEFDQLFEIDYSTMFDKLIMSPLKGYLAATGFQNVDPRDQQLTDIFAF